MAILILLIVVGGVYYRGADEREIKTLIAEQEFLQGASLANQYLKTHSNSKGIRVIASEALIKHVIPSWLENVESAQFVAADNLLADARSISEYNPDGLAMLDVLTWVGDLEDFMIQRGGPNAPIVLFEHEDKIHVLVEWWESDTIGRQRSLDRILTYEPSFKDVHSRASSHLRRLRREQSLYLKAIADLKKTIDKKLTSDRPEDLASVWLRRRRRRSRHPA